MAPVPILYHESQFPERLTGELLSGLRTGRLNHKFLYGTYRQTSRWLALHQACSPSRNDPECASVYRQAFEFAAEHMRGAPTHLAGLGCGGGKKDSAFLSLLQEAGSATYYTALDVGAPMVLTAAAEAARVIPERNCRRIVCDLSLARDLPDLLKSFQSGLPETGLSRVVTFFGMIPNFRPSEIMPKLACLVGEGDLLLFSANLAPGPDYEAGVHRVLPQYDNVFTREWLMAFLDFVGIPRNAGELRFSIGEEDGLKRIVANFTFTSACQIEIEAQEVRFDPGQVLRLFYSFRHTRETIRQLLAQHDLRILQEWITPSEEEAVFAAVSSRVR